MQHDAEDGDENHESGSDDESEPEFLAFEKREEAAAFSFFRIFVSGYIFDDFPLWLVLCGHGRHMQVYLRGRQSFAMGTVGIRAPGRKRLEGALRLLGWRSPTFCYPQYVRSYPF